MARNLALFALLSISSGSAFAIDTVYVVDQEKRVAGKISNVTRDGITVSSNISGDTEVPTNQIEKIEFDGEPPQLRLVRTVERNGNYADALKQYSDLLTKIGDNEALKGEIEFLIARTKGRLGEADEAARKEGLAALKEYADSHRTHYRYYDSQLLYGTLATIDGDYTRARIAFDSVGKSPFNDYQMAAKVALANGKLAEGDVDEAAKLYGEVAAAKASNSREKSEALAALLGQAKVQSTRKQYDDAIKTLNQVIRQTTASDTAVQAEAYLRQGDAYAASGANPKAAVMAYLHVDVVPSLAREASKHAEALYRLVQLWPVVGQQGRAAESSARLRDLYPNSEWTSKLNG